MESTQGLSRKKHLADSGKLSTIRKQLIHKTFVIVNMPKTDIGPSLAANMINAPQISFDECYPVSYGNFEHNPIIFEEVHKLVEKLPANKADGLDGIPASLLEASMPRTTASMTHHIIQHDCQQ